MAKKEKKSPVEAETCRPARLNFEKIHVILKDGRFAAVPEGPRGLPARELTRAFLRYIC